MERVPVLKPVRRWRPVQRAAWTQRQRTTAAVWAPRLGREPRLTPHPAPQALLSKIPNYLIACAEAAQHEVGALHGRRTDMKSRLIAMTAALPLALTLAGCSPDDEPSALRNVERNQQEYQNTATDPAGPREISPPSNMTNQ
jgi:hypothetical protein